MLSLIHISDKVREVLTTLYHDRPDGLSGNEDVGQMSAWYVLSSLGMYEACLLYTSGFHGVAAPHMAAGVQLTVRRAQEDVIARPLLHLLFFQTHQYRSLR